jgi:hypothetical protein
MAFKIDIEHRGRFLTFGPRFKGETGKDIFAAKVALGILRPIPAASEEENSIELGTELSYDSNIPLDEQKWFDCSTGLGVDLAKATKFDTTLENALIKFQLDNQFLITSYYFEKFGYLKLLNAATNDKTIFEAEIASQISVSMGLFESELRTLGEATIAIMHGWLPGTRLATNTSYTHDDRVYSNSNIYDGRLPTVFDLVPIGIYNNLLDPEYSQNFASLLRSGLAIPGTLAKSAIANGPRDGESFMEWLSRSMESNRAWASTLGDEFLNFEYGSLQYYPVLTAKSSLYTAASQVVDYYLENDLFSQTLSQEELNEQARRAIYPDPFSREDVFIIDGTRLGIYTDTEYFLRAEGPLPPASLQEETQEQLEERALKTALDKSQKPEIWYFLKDDEKFKQTYPSRDRSSDASSGPDHSGDYPSRITLSMSASLRENYGDLYSPHGDTTGFKKENYWVLTADETIIEAGDNQNKAQHWRVLESSNASNPLIRFKEFITPSLRPGQSYRALFEINRQKFELITDGEGFEQPPESATLDVDPTSENVCLDQNSEQAERAYEEYRSHAIKRRREMVRKIREAVRSNDGSRTTVNLGVLGDLDLGGFNNLNMDTQSDYEVMQKVAQVLPGQEAIDFITGFSASTKDRKLNNPDNDTNNLSITVEELKERVDKAAEDLREAQDIITRERIKFEKGTDFNGQNEAAQLSAFFTDTIDREFGKKYKNLSKEELSTSLDFSFRATGVGLLGHRSGKDVTSFAGNKSAGLNEVESKKIFTRPRTNNYLSLIKDMTAAPKFSGFFDDSRNSCKDLGINIDKITAYAFVTKYTSGLKAAARKEEDFSFKSWFENNVTDPIKEFGATSAQNFEDSFDPDNFPEDAALRALGQECDLEKVWLGALDKLDLVSLLCDYIKCIKLPPFDFKAPDFRLPPLPKVPILGWYAGFYKFVRDNYEQILTRLACTASKMIIDKLAFPFCEEQLQDFIQNDLLSKNQYAKQAVIESLTRTGVPDADKAKDFFDATSNILTGRELCYIFKGNMPDDATMSAITRMAAATGVSEYLGTPEDVINFFGVVGVYLPDEICDQLNNQTIVSPTNCDDTNDLLRGVRNRLQTGDATLSDEEINRVVNSAEQSKQEEADRLKSFLDNGFSGLVPPIFQYGNESAPMSDFPEHFKKEQEKTAESIFSVPKKAYSEGLAQYVPAMYVGSPVDLWPYDERYDQWQVLRLESALEQLRVYAETMDPITGFNPRPESQWASLHTLYEVEIINTIPGNLISEDKKASLQILEGTENSSNPDYIVPHDTEIFNPQRNSYTGKLDIQTKRNSVLVHKRKIAGMDTKENIEFALIGLEDVIDRYDKRVRRTSDGKQDRLKRQREPFLTQRTELKNLLYRLEQNPETDLSQAGVVSYEFFMAYQQNINSEEIENYTDDSGNRLQFALIPWLVTGPDETGSEDYRVHSMDYEYSKFLREYLETDANLISSADCVERTMSIEYNAYGIPSFSYDCVEYAPKPNYGELKENGKRIFDTPTAAAYFRLNFSRTGEDDANANIQTAINAVSQRINDLSSRITEIITNRPPISDDLLLPGLEELLDQRSEIALESSDSTAETVASSGQQFSLEFRATTAYSPKITLREMTAAEGKDRYDMIIEGDFFIGLDLESASGPAGREVYSYCNQLPDAYTHPRPQMRTQEDFFSSKRHRFSNMLIDKLKSNFSYQRQNTNNQYFETEFTSGEFYKRTTEAIIESLLEELSESYLFESEEVERLDNRIVGKRQRSTCVSNRFSFGDASVVAFNKAILGDVSTEIAKEMAKPENAPENYDFDSPSAFDKAMQNLAFKGFIKTCLMDILLKGGLAYSRWDVEPIVEEQFFIDYAISYVFNELQSSSELKDSWRINIENVTGISNSKVALDTLVKQELIRLPNYSKQIFNPENNSTNFYNWFLEEKTSHFHVSKFADSESQPYSPHIAKHINRIYDNQNEKVFIQNKPEFVVEHYIEITGSQLVSLYLDVSGAFDLPLSLVDDISDTLILNVIDFAIATQLIDPDALMNAIEQNFGKISQGSRIVLVEPVNDSADDVRFIGFDPNADPGEQQQEVDDEYNQFSKALRNIPGISEDEIASRSAIMRSFQVTAKTTDRGEGDNPVVFAIPLVEYKRELDFEDCYSIRNYSLDSFTEAIPFMIQEMTKSEDYVLLLDNIFPTRRLMSMASVFSTSVVSGYNNMPTILTPTKSSLASLVNTLGLGRRQRAELQTLSQEEFVKQFTENFPTDESNCIDFPSGLEDMFKKFFEELFKLIRQMPSIIFRGVANQLDPAYKEMRQHYINCDINHLTYRGLRPAGTGDYKITNGLYLKGTPRLKPNPELQEYEGKNKGKYVPLTLGFASDLTYALGAIPNFSIFGARLGISIAKLVTYIYAGNRPFLDPSSYFKIPCADIDVGAWRNKGKYDAGIYGRYGHPLSPFTLLALATPQLEGDKRAKEANCQVPLPECVELNTGNAPPPEIPREDRDYHRPPGSSIGSGDGDGLLDEDIQNPDIMGGPESDDTRTLDFEDCRESWEARVETGNQDRLVELLDDTARIEIMLLGLRENGYDSTDPARPVDLEGPFADYNSMTIQQLLEARDWYFDTINEIKSSYSELELQCASADEYIEYTGAQSLIVMSLLSKVERNREEQARSNDRRR